MTDFLVGDHVDVNGQHAVVRYVGRAAFSDGEWIGVELDTPTGKNNGTVQGETYFVCKDKHGMFVKPFIPRLMERPLSSLQHMKKPPISATPKPGQRPLNLKSPPKPASPTKAYASAPPPAPPTPRTSTPTITRTPSTHVRQASSASNASRPGTMGPPPAPGKSVGAVRRVSGIGLPTPNATPLQRTTSVSSTGSGTVGGVSAGGNISGSGSRASGGNGNNGSNNRLGLKPGNLTVSVRKTSATSTSSERSSPDGSSSTGGPMRRTRSGDNEAARASPGPGRSLASGSGARRDSMGPGKAPGMVRSATTTEEIATTGSTVAAGGSAAVVVREIEDLKSKIKVLEKKRLEDREKLKLMERIQAERDKFESIIHKLQAKYQPQQQELTELRKQLKEIEAEMSEMEQVKAEHEIIVEMATLDREMAEEQSEALRSELDIVRGKAEELEMEIEILREENAELTSGMTPEEKTGAGWMQMEKQNERLKEALLRLREITSQQEAELKDAIRSLEEDVNELSQYKEQYENTKDKLIVSESALEDLRQQLDTALGAEEMLEELTERNMYMSEQVEELKATIEDLESLKEVSDELEINHVETEKQMQEELDFKDLVIGEQARRIAQLDSSNEEAEYTITRFRDLVANLHSDLEDMRASQQLTETEAEELTARSRSMMDINMKLQITAAKAQNKTIDLELRRFEAEEAIEHLSIVQMFLPESFFAEKDSILALLRFKRVSFKANLLHSFVKERLTGQAGQIQSGQEDSIMAACDMCDKLTWVSAMCDRFVNCISGCNVAQFSRFQGALFELDPVERALNGWIEGLRKDDLKEKQCVAELQRTMALMSHLGELHLKNDLEGFASDIHMRVLLMQSYMESTAAAISHTKLLVQNKVSTIFEDDETALAFTKKADTVISNSRSVKVVVGKILRSLNDFQQRSLSLTQDKLSQFEACEEATKKLADYSRAVGEDIHDLLYSDESGSEAASWILIQSTLFRTTEKILKVAESDVFGAFGKELKNLTSLLIELGGTAADIDMTAEFEKAPTPWVVKAQELKATKVVSVDTEEEIRRLKDDILERATQIKLREKSLEEAAVKIELLESRMRNVTKQSEIIEQLEKQVNEGTVREKDFADAIENQNEEISALETEIAKWKKIANDKRVVGEADRSGAAAERTAVATAKEVERLRQEIKSLQAAVQFFREENKRIQSDDLVSADSWLLEPLLPTADVKEVQDYEQALAKEGQDVLSELMSLVAESKVIDLTTTPKNRKAWRPAKSTPQYIFLKQRENYETLAAWRDDVVSRALYHDDAKAEFRPRKSRKARSVFGARVDIRVPVKMPRKVFPVTEVVIQEPEGWEQFTETLGIA
ncbi:hypothetical protein RUND412_006393 [Rhizina undulata]